MAKMFRVFIDFAHGVRYGFTLNTETKEKVEKWIDVKNRPKILQFTWDNKTYRFNRDYICACVIREIKPGEKWSDYKND